MLVDRKTSGLTTFAFVDMGSETEEISAIKALDGLIWQGRSLAVKQARSSVDDQCKDC